MAIADFIPTKRGSFDWHTRLLIDFLNWGLPLLKTGDYEVKGEIARTGLVPLWYTPYLLCPPRTIPPLATPDLTWEGKKLMTCLRQWTTTIIDAIGVGTLEPRRPGAWPKTQFESAITAEWLLPWEDLRRWAAEAHGVDIGEVRGPDQAPDSTRGAPASDIPEEPTSEAVTSPNASGWPYTHDTKLLAAVRWVIETYWEDKDESMWPTKEFVHEKLRSLYPNGQEFSDREIRAIDQVTRHDARRNRAPK